MSRKKILFVAEAVTLAHVGRPLALAEALDPARYDIHFSCADRYDFCFKNSSFTRRSIDSIPSEQFLRALAAGSPVYDYQTLSGYVAQDLRLLESVQPDLVVGDFRLSLSVSARLAKVPYVAISNAYWSPYFRQNYTVPDLPMTKVLPVGIANPLFKFVRPMAFALHAVPLNRIRRKFGLPSLGFDLRRVYTDADYTMYADIPELFPARELPANHSYLGPVVWSPPVEKAVWWDVLPETTPVIYVTLGSSGQGRLLPLVLQSLKSLPVTVIAASAGKVDMQSIPRNAYVADYLPGEEAARRASVVICNGGSPTSQQALAAGVPVIGIAGNLDQFLNMGQIQSAGAGKLLRADRFDAIELENAVNDMMNVVVHKNAALKIAECFERYPAGSRFVQFLSEALDNPSMRKT